MAMNAALRKWELLGGPERPTAGQIRNLGLLGKEEESKKTLKSLEKGS